MVDGERFAPHLLRLTRAPRLRNGISWKGEPHMKKLLFVASALAALSLLAPNAGFAAGAHNQLGMYTDMDAGDFTGTSVTAGSGTQVVAYLVLTNCYDEVADAPVNSILAFECSVIVPSNLFMGTTSLAPTGVNLVTPPLYSVGFVEAPTATGPNNAMLLATFTFFTTSSDPAEIFLGLMDPPSIPGTMAIADAADVGNLISIYPSSGDFANPVFGINSGVIATENESWGGVKALFR